MTWACAAGRAKVTNLASSWMTSIERTSTKQSSGTSQWKLKVSGVSAQANIENLMAKPTDKFRQVKPEPQHEKRYVVATVSCGVARVEPDLLHCRDLAVREARALISFQPNNITSAYVFELEFPKEEL